jgi:DNA-binding NarL/FixJ family response regulator
VRVVIAEDMFPLREGLIRLLEAYGLEVAAVTDNGDDFLAAIRSGGCDVAIVDMRLPPTFTDAVTRVARGGTVMDPEVIARLLSRSSAEGPAGKLSPREREVLALMAEGRSNAAIAGRMFVTERAVAKHTASIFAKLDLQPSDDDNRRVLAVLAYLGR